MPKWYLHILNLSFTFENCMAYIASDDTQHTFLLDIYGNGNFEMRKLFYCDEQWI